jgi:leader peptidase (prepilin peptidase)/N-methyltransferase
MIPTSQLLLLQTLTFALGAAIGSFLNVVIARLPKGESIVRPRSKCPSCGQMITWWQNIPIASWLLLRGRCFACKNPISLRYPVVEILTAALFLASLQRFGLSLAFAASVVMCTGLLAITFIDIDEWLIPDEIALPGIAIGTFLRPLAFDVPWFSGLLGAFIGTATLWLIRFVHMSIQKREGMGLGDVKLIAMIGAFVGPGGLLPTIMVGSFVGSIVGGTLLLVRRFSGEAAPGEATPAPPPSPPPDAPTSTSDDDDDDDDWVPPKDAVPFGPFLSLGAIATMLFEPVFRSVIGGLDLLYRF